MATALCSAICVTLWLYVEVDLYAAYDGFLIVSLLSPRFDSDTE